MGNDNTPPGWPGIPPRWTSSAKNGVGTSLDAHSQVWFTHSHGILNEIYFPRVDQACTRDLGLIVTDGRGFFSEEKRHTRTEVRTCQGVPCHTLINTCTQGRYRIEKELLADPSRSVVLQRTLFTPLAGSVADYHLYVLAAPHLANHGAGNTAWVGDYKGVPMLFAERNGHALALASSLPWRKRSVGYVGVSDGWQDLDRHKQMQWQYSRAEDGNVAMTGEVDLSAGAEFVLAIGFGSTWQEAAQMAVGSLYDGFPAAKELYLRAWQDWHETLLPLDAPAEPDEGRNLYRVSTAVLRTHHSKMFPGGIIASLSIPWGFAKGDDDLGGYHLVWPRDLVETAGGLLAAGAREGALHVLEFLQVTQEGDGHWPQNMWLDGAPYWNGVQMDETAFPILLVDLLQREGCMGEAGVQRFWPMVRRAASFLVCNGPVTGQDRWEEDPGYSPFTLAIEIAALVVAADIAESQGESSVAAYLRETADAWYDTIDRWTYVTGTDLALQFDIPGYYIRIAPADAPCAASPAQGFVPIKNQPPSDGSTRADHLISPDFLALVRCGLRAPDDPRILNTLRIVDAMLKVEAPQGPLWRRYNGDGYGEHADGSAFDGTGIGRAWPLLTGERAHYELAAGNVDAARRLLRTLELCADEGGLLPEQTWDAPDIPERDLFFGRPTGAARPLVWAHAEYIKLLRSLRYGRVFDQPPQPTQRYLAEKPVPRHVVWAPNNKTRYMCAGKILRLSLTEPAMVHWSDDGWATATDVLTRPSGLGTHLADLPTEQLPVGSNVVFTFYWTNAALWEGADYAVAVGT